MTNDNTQKPDETGARLCMNCTIKHGGSFGKVTRQTRGQCPECGQIGTLTPVAVTGAKTSL